MMCRERQRGIGEERVDLRIVERGPFEVEEQQRGRNGRRPLLVAGHASAVPRVGGVDREAQCGVVPGSTEQIGEVGLVAEVVAQLGDVEGGDLTTPPGRARPPLPRPGRSTNRRRRRRAAVRCPRRSRMPQVGGGVVGRTFGRSAWRRRRTWIEPTGRWPGCRVRGRDRRVLRSARADGAPRRAARISGGSSRTRQTKIRSYAGVSVRASRVVSDDPGHQVAGHRRVRVRDRRAGRAR